MLQETYRRSTGGFKERIEELQAAEEFIEEQQKDSRNRIHGIKWVFDRERQESVETLREWVLQEAEFSVMASETLHGLSQKGKTIARGQSKSDLLIGMDYLELHRSYQDIIGKEGDPIARLTPLGWTCVGRIPGFRDVRHSAGTYFTDKRETELSSMLQKLWEVDDVQSVTSTLTKDDESVLASVKDTVKFENGIPWKESVSPLPDNWDIAYKHLCNTEKKLSKNEQIAVTYDGIISQYVEKGYIEKVSLDENNSSRGWYLPHLPVVRPDRETTKVRIVFDASAKCEGVSLNDTIHQGPKLQAQYITQEHARRFQNTLPKAAETVLKSTYMDDNIDSVRNELEAIELYEQLSELWGNAGMCARKWLSNSPQVLQRVPIENKATEVDLGRNELPPTKTLGLTSELSLRVSGELTYEELLDAEIYHISRAQREEFNKEVSALENRKQLSTSSKLIGLDPMLDEDGLIRCRGRLQHAKFLPFDAKFPIVLPRRNWVTKLIVKKCHEDGKHIIGINQILALLSARYWIISAREEIREYKKECPWCRRLKAKPIVQIMAPLPQVRLKYSLRAFDQTGVDFAGPFMTIQESVDYAEFSPRRRWRRVQELVHHFWKRWMSEWLPSLQVRKKWLTPSRDLEVDDVVVVVSPQSPRGSWITEDES
ncbi:uncharacterized protein [Haliotis asinina]|uniref:uncharacterized protein n=1 Tax=Haliotis asinina TaxID=109174 RepID=UPI0035327F42